jgi:antirestriction protein ArdC
MAGFFIFRRMKMKLTLYQRITDQIISLLEKGTVPWNCPWSTVSGILRNLTSNKVYRGVNLFLLAFSGYSSQYWLTFKQCKELDGNVKKGEKGWPVLFWKSLRDDNRNDQDPEEDRPRFVARYYTVFNATQTEGIDFPQPTIQNQEFDPIIQCEQIVSEMPNKPSIAHDEQRAYYSPLQDIVNVPQGIYFSEESEYYSTLFHELAHSTGHQSRLNRPSLTESKGFGSDPYCHEELVAEMTAAMLCGYTGIDGATIENSAAYISHWIEKLKENPRFVVNAASQAQKASDYILNSRFDHVEKSEGLLLSGRTN